jgi:DNA mismatch repair protein MSH2
MSVFGLLNHCLTPMGSRLLLQWLKQPLMDVEAIRERHAMVDVMVNAMELRQNMQQEHLKNVPDLSKLAKRLQRQKGSLKDVVQFYNAVLGLPRLMQDVEQNLPEDDDGAATFIRGRFLRPLTTFVADLGKFTEMVETTIDLEATRQHQYRVRPQFDATLEGTLLCLLV